jgi:hypothetical protein
MLRSFFAFCLLLILAMVALAHAAPVTGQTVPNVHLPLIRTAPSETPLVVDSTAGIASTSLSTYTVETPRHSKGDLLLIALATDAFTTTLHGPAGWTVQRENVPIRGTARFGLWSKIAGDTEAESSIVRNNRPDGRGARAGWGALSIDALRINAGSAIHAQGVDTEGSGVTARLPEITTTIDNCLLVAIVFTDRLALPLGTPEGWTKVVNSGVEGGGTVGVYTKIKTTAGTESGPEVTLGVREQWAGVTLAIAPEVATR